MGQGVAWGWVRVGKRAGRGRSPRAPVLHELPAPLIVQRVADDSGGVQVPVCKALYSGQGVTDITEVALG